MSKTATVTFTGVSGAKYTLDAYPSNTSFNNVSAVYVFTRMYTDNTGTLRFQPLYIGETSELGRRMENHEKWPCVTKHGCTHICIKVATQHERLDIETDLRNSQ